MRNIYIFLTALGIFIVLVLFAVFGQVGSPVAQHLIAYDKTRLTNFSTIRSSIDTYYSTNRELPKSLSSLSYVTGTTDPETKKPYDYLPATDGKYQLCTTFSTDSTKQDKYTLNPYGSKPISYKKGYACVTYEVSSYILQTVPTSTQPQVVITYPYLGDSLCLHTQQRITWDTYGEKMQSLSIALVSQDIPKEWNGKSEMVIADVVNPNQGVYNWVPGSEVETVVPPGSKYYIVIRATTTAGKSLTASSGLFTLKDCSSDNKPPVGTVVTQ